VGAKESAELVSPLPFAHVFLDAPPKGGKALPIQLHEAFDGSASLDVFVGTSRTTLSHLRGPTVIAYRLLDGLLG
jgi:hypothetical protein